MGLSSNQRDLTLSSWIKPSSDDEKTQQDRAERLVREAINESDEIDNHLVEIYTKGSYPNNTNVRRDSDVDVVVELQACFYARPTPGVTLINPSPTTPYVGPWTPSNWRAAVKKAMVDYFGESSVDTSGRVAINISAVAGSRPSADVVPSFLYYRYEDAYKQEKKQGSCVFPSDGGDMIVNWPAQQLANGRTFNTTTGSRYKNFVRALKNAENILAAAGTIKDLPSYFMECLVYNVPAATLSSGSSLAADFQSTLSYLYYRLDDGTAYTDWVEPNRMKWLFKGHQKWTVEQAKALVLHTYSYLRHGD